MERNFPLYTLEDYLELTGTPKGDYGFALLKAGDERVLLGYEKKDGEMRYWLKNAGAVPQGGKGGWFAYSPRGETIYGEEFKTDLSDGLSFQVIVSEGESYDRYTAYHWEDGGFKLTGYRDWAGFYGNVAVDDGVLHFSNWLEGWDFGKVYGTVQRDLRYVSYDALPKTIEEAREKLTDAPELAHGSLMSVPNIDVQKVKFTGGRKYPVYQGPGEQYGRAANGKASVSTNDWIQVFCRYNGYVMIQYDISAEQYRVGWIDEEALPRDASVREVDLQMELEDQTTLAYDCELTDDPYNSRKSIAALKAGTPVLEVIYNLYGWSYVRVTVDGQTVCGFVPSDAPIHG
ncbi:MAG: hypothetical protein ACI4O4_04575 [Candidatus Ventricola sp.]